MATVSGIIDSPNELAGENDYEPIVLADEPLQPIAPLPVAGMGKLIPRNYQVECVEQIYRHLSENRSTMAVLATGLGKTVVAAETVLQLPPECGRVLFLAHRKELIEQAANSIGAHIDEGCGIEMAKQSDARKGGLVHRSRVVVASVQTLMKDSRLKAYRPSEFGLVITDECHHATADSYKKIFGWFQQNRQCRFLGITATPDRADSELLGTIYDTVAYEKDICSGIDGGWLVPIVQKFVRIEGLDFSTCRTTAGDVNARDLERAMAGDAESEDEDAKRKHEELLHRVADPAVKEARGRPGIVFCVTVRHAEDMAMMLRRYGCTAEAVTQETSSDRRAEIIRDFKSGKLQWLVGVGVFTEGFDAPNAEVIVVARPTKSRALYTQMVGRGTRPLLAALSGCGDADSRKAAIAGSAKPNCTVLDFVGNSGRHKLICTADILGNEFPEDLREAVLVAMREREEGFDPREEMAKEQSRREAAEKLRVEQERLAKEAAEQKRLEAEERRRREVERSGVKAKVNYRTETVDAFGEIVGHQKSVGNFPRGSSSEKQVEYLVKLGVSREKAMSFDKGQAGKVITRLLALSGKDFRITFGKYAGKSLAEVGDGWCQWVINDMQPSERRTELLKHIKIMREGD